MTVDSDENPLGLRFMKWTARLAAGLQFMLAALLLLDGWLWFFDGTLVVAGFVAGGLATFRLMYAGRLRDATMAASRRRAWWQSARWVEAIATLLAIPMTYIMIPLTNGELATSEGQLLVARSYIGLVGPFGILGVASLALLVSLHLPSTRATVRRDAE